MIQKVEHWEGLTLILVPHSDDEVLLAAGIIYTCCKLKKEIAVCIATNGDYLATTHEIGIQRLKESINACKLLGLDISHIYALGYADTGMKKEDSFLARLYHDKNNITLSSNISNTTYGITNILDDYSYQCTKKHSLYNRKSFIQDLKNIINQLNPKRIITTSRFDKHGDHYALALFLKELNMKHITIYEGLVHSFEGDETWPMRNNHSLLAFNEPNNFTLSTNLQWNDRIIIKVPKVMQSLNKDNLKLKALTCYKSAYCNQSNDTKTYLESFIKLDEVFFINRSQ